MQQFLLLLIPFQKAYPMLKTCLSGFAAAKYPFEYSNDCLVRIIILQRIRGFLLSHNSFFDFIRTDTTILLVACNYFCITFSSPLAFLLHNVLHLTADEIKLGLQVSVLFFQLFHLLLQSQLLTIIKSSLSFFECLLSGVYQPQSFLQYFHCLRF